MQHIKTIALSVVTGACTGVALASQGPGVSLGGASPATQWIAVLCGIALATIGAAWVRQRDRARNAI